MCMFMGSVLFLGFGLGFFILVFACSSLGLELESEPPWSHVFGFLCVYVCGFPWLEFKISLLFFRVRVM